MVNSNNKVISPLATAVWLIENTSLTFKQIGDFCELDEKEVQLIADGVFAKGIMPTNPITTGCLTKEEIEKREKDGGALQNTFKSLDGLDIKITKRRKHISTNQAKNRPEAILWLISYYKDLSDGQIVKLLHTTKNMIAKIRDKTYKNYNSLVAKDPVILGFCSQKDIDNAIKKSKKE